MLESRRVRLVLTSCRGTDLVAQLPKHPDRFIRSVTHEGADLPPSPTFAPLGQDSKCLREDIDLKLEDDELQEVFEAGTHSGSTDREVQGGQNASMVGVRTAEQPRHRAPLSVDVPVRCRRGVGITHEIQTGDRLPVGEPE